MKLQELTEMRNNESREDLEKRIKKLSNEMEAAETQREKEDIYVELERLGSKLDKM